MKIILKEFISGVPKNHDTCCKKMFENVSLVNNIEQQLISILEGLCMNMGRYFHWKQGWGSWPSSSHKDCTWYNHIIYLVNFLMYLLFHRWPIQKHISNGSKTISLRAWHRRCWPSCPFCWMKCLDWGDSGHKAGLLQAKGLYTVLCREHGPLLHWQQGWGPWPPG